MAAVASAQSVDTARAGGSGLGWRGHNTATASTGAEWDGAGADATDAAGCFWAACVASARWSQSVRAAVDYWAAAFWLQSYADAGGYATLGHGTGCASTGACVGRRWWRWWWARGAGAVVGSDPRRAVAAPAVD